jgi:hypothetical protein
MGRPSLFLSRFRGMMNTPQLAAPFLGVAIFDTARLAVRSFIITGPKKRAATNSPINHSHSDVSP